MSGPSWRNLFRRRPSPQEAGYCESPTEFLGGNRVAALHDGRQAYPAMLEAIRGARRTVHLETYILRSDATGWEFARALAERARAAVRVRVIFDSVGSLEIDEDFLQFLRNAGISLLEYHPVAPWRPRWAWGRRDHRKILVVDGEVGFTGGINIADDYADPARGGGGWRDTDVRIEGPAAYELDRLFRAVWFMQTGRWFKLEGDPEKGAGDSLVRVAANQEFLHRHRIRRAYRHALGKAARSVCVANAYFVPDRTIRKALYRAVRRGVSVRVLVQGESDVPAVTWASRRVFEELLRNGVRLFVWPGPVLHSKTVVVDGFWSAVGSYNMDHRSLLHNLEVNLHIIDAEFGRDMEAAFEADLAGARELRLSEWRARPWQDRLLEHAFYLLRYWL